MNARAGFSLIEALVALIVAAMALTAIFELQQQLVRGQLRYERALGLAQLERDALALTRDINPTAAPNGDAPLTGGRTIRWTSTPLSAPQPNLDFPKGPGRYEVRLYRVRVDILDPRRRLLGQLAFERMGWRRLD